MNLEKQQIERELFQSECVELSKEYNFLAIEVATGTGKGLAVMKCIEEDKSEDKWLILMPEVLQIINFQDDVKKHGMSHIYDKIEDVICYASLHKFEGKTLKLWCNEVHRLSECRTDISKTLKTSKIIVDSATISEEIKERLATLGNFYYYRLNTKEAIDKGILPEPVYYIKGIDLQNTEKYNKAVINKKEVLMTDKFYSMHLDSNLEYWKTRLNEHPKETWIKNKLITIGTIRKNFFALVKTKYVKDLVDKLGSKRCVIFCGTTGQSDEIGGDLSIHSKKGVKTNIKTLEAFNTKQIDKVYFNKMGREGMNLKDIECVIITQLSTGNDDGLEFVQTSGRGFRGLNPEIYLFYCKGTRDQVFLEKALKNIDKKYVKWL